MGINAPATADNKLSVGGHITTSKWEDQVKATNLRPVAAKHNLNIDTNANDTGVYINPVLGKFASINQSQHAFYGPDYYATGDVHVGGKTITLGELATGQGDSGATRALVKGANAELIVNYQKDFKGGTRVASDLTVDGNLKAASLGGPQLFSHFPWQDGATYIRAGKQGANINIGDIGASAVRLRDSWFPFTNNDTYIRPGADGKNINIGDVWASGINIGKGNSKISLKGDTTVAGKLVMQDTSNPNKTYNLQKVSTGSNQGALRLSLADSPSDSLEVYGTTLAHSLRGDGRAQHMGDLCIGNACINEAQLTTIKQKAGLYSLKLEISEVLQLLQSSCQVLDRTHHAAHQLWHIDGQDTVACGFDGVGHDCLHLLRDQALPAACFSRILLVLEVNHLQLQHFLVILRNHAVADIGFQVAIRGDVEADRVDIVGQHNRRLEGAHCVCDNQAVLACYMDRQVTAIVDEVDREVACGVAA
eukprot:jgi/Chrzof1/8014/UNPLg00065.t1